MFEWITGYLRNCVIGQKTEFVIDKLFLSSVRFTDWGQSGQVACVICMLGTLIKILQCPKNRIFDVKSFLQLSVINVNVQYLMPDSWQCLKKG